tara:strand:- start:29 stop:379 length:351 start_codon:yes stop_codon:yes gene_type:complete
MIDIEFLSGCDDNQINRGVAWIEAINLDINTMQRLIIISALSGRIFKNWRIFNPCANPNDIMPIAFANRIDIKHDYDVLESVTVLIGDEDDYLYWATNTNPLRAICEVYILMSVNK